MWIFKRMPMAFLFLFGLVQHIFSSCPDQDYGVYLDTLSPGVVNAILYRYGPNANGMFQKFNPDTTTLSKWRNTFRFVEEKTVTEFQLRSVIKLKSDSAKTIVLASLDSLTFSKLPNMDSLVTAHWKAKQIYKGSLPNNVFSVSANLSNTPFYKRQGLLNLEGKQAVLFLQKGIDRLLTLPVAEQDGPCSFSSSSFVVEQGRVSRTGFYWLGLPGVSLDFSALMQGVVGVKSPSRSGEKLSIRSVEGGLYLYHNGLEKGDYRVTIFNTKGVTVDIFNIHPFATHVWTPSQKTAGIYHVEFLSGSIGNHKRLESEKVLLW